MTTSFDLTAKQYEAQEILASPSKHIMLFGGSRSGKTFLLIRALVLRALKEKSRHAALRFRFNHIKSSIVLDTFPKVMELCYDGFPYKVDKSDWYAKFPNGSEIWFGGLDEKERTEKILGQEYSTIFLNECSQIPYSARNMAVTRLAENSGLPLKMYYDCNPPPQSHWTYQTFIKSFDPDSRAQLINPDHYAAMLLNPDDNRDNLPADYIEELEALPERLRRRFLKGEFLPANENALWSPEVFDKHRVMDGKLPELQRIVIAVDPSGADEDENVNNDDIGVAVVGLGTDGCGYVLEDLTLKAGPATWGGVVGSAYDRHSADLVVGEDNFGGAMVKHTIQTARPNTPYKKVTASRGKVVRAEPISALYETGKVRHVGFFPELEDELCDFTTTGFAGTRSPNRADAVVWALTELFPGMTKPDRQKKAPPRPPARTGWMAA